MSTNNKNSKENKTNDKYFKKFKINNNYDDNVYDNDYLKKHFNVQKERGPAFYMDLANDPQKTEELVMKIANLERGFNNICMVESKLQNFEYHLRRVQINNRRELAKHNQTIEDKLLFNVNWCESPLTLRVNKNIVKPENYKLSGIRVMEEEKPKGILVHENFHDPLAVERRLLERGIVRRVNPINKETKMFKYKIGDLGCSTRLTALYMPGQIVFNRPIVEARDKLRRQDLEARLEDRYGNEWQNEVVVCDCKQGKVLCTHLEECDIINMTHSIYYLDRELINYIIKKKKKITATLHIFAPGSYTYDYYSGTDHLVTIEKEGNKVKFNVMNDKIYEHKNYFNYLWDKNELVFNNCTVSVFSRIHHEKFQHISIIIEPFKSEKVDYDTPFNFILTDAVKDPKIALQEKYTQICSKSNEMYFGQEYNEGEIGYIRVLDAEGKQQFEENGKEKRMFVRKITDRFIFPKLVNTNWLSFESVSLYSEDNKKDYLYVKEELIGQCIKTLQTEVFEKAYPSIISKIMTQVNNSNPDIIVTIVTNILESFYKLKMNLQFVEKSALYNMIKNKAYEKYDTISLWRPIDYLKDKLFNTQKKIKLSLNENILKNKRVNRVLSKRLVKKINGVAQEFNSKYKIVEPYSFYFNVKEINKSIPQPLIKKQQVQAEAKKEYIEKRQQVVPVIFKDHHLPKDINFNVYKPEDIQKAKEFLNKNLFCDNFLLKNYLSKYGIVPRNVEKQKYKIAYSLRSNILFRKEDLKLMAKDLKSVNWKLIHNDMDKVKVVKNDCLFHALALAVKEEGEDAQKVAYIMKQDSVKASLNDGKYLDYLSDEKKGLEYVRSLMEYYQCHIAICDQDDLEKGQFTVVEYLKVDDEFNEENDFIILAKKGNHLNAVRRGPRLLFGSLAEEYLENERVLPRKCISRKLYEEFVVHLADTKDKFVCPQYPSLNANTSYEEFCQNVPCYCEGPMCLGHTLYDDERDETAIFYGQCPRVQIVGTLRQLLPQNQYSPSLLKEIESFIDRFLDEKDIDSLIEKHFRNIDYSRWLSRCKPNYRKRILRHLQKVEDWYSIEEPNIVNGMIKEEIQSVGDKARMLGCPTILHKILIGPIESNFENLFHEMFPDFWGVGESTNEKEYQLTKLIEKINATHAVTLDISGLDQSHNKLVKRFWMKICQKVKNYLEDKGNSLFNPENIYKALTKHTTIIINRDNRDRSKIVCMAELKNKMASGQGYTTVLNTSLMCLLLEFLKEKFSINIAGKISGDDCGLVTSEDEEALSNAFGYVFSKKGANNLGGSGLVMKYFRYGDLDTISPCSLLSFVCPNHGLRLVRLPERYLDNFFYSQRMLSMPKHLHVPFFNTVCVGEQYWSAGYSFFHEINECNPPSEQQIRELIAFCNGTAKTKVTKYSEDLAYELFAKRGYIIEGKFQTNYEYIFNREFNYIRNEDKHENHKIPVYACCDAALTSRLIDITPDLITRTKFSTNFATKTVEEYYSKLNKPVNFKYKINKIYKLPKYEDLQKLRQQGKCWGQNQILPYDCFVYAEMSFYSQKLRYFINKISPWRQFLR